jgi:hypothetical protein
VSFAAYPLDTHVASSLGNFSYSCDGGQPKMHASIESNGISEYTQYLITGCSYVNPAYTSQLRRQSLAPVQYTSYSYTGCPSSSNGNARAEEKLPPGSAAAVAMAVLLFAVCLSSGLYCLLFDGSCTRRKYSYGRGGGGGLQVRGPGSDYARDTIQLTGVHASI